MNLLILKPLLIIVESYFGKKIQFDRAWRRMQTKRNEILCPKDDVLGEGKLSIGHLWVLVVK